MKVLFLFNLAVQYVPSMVYHPVAMFGAPPVMFSPLTVFPSPGPPYQTNGGNDQETMQNLQTAQQQQVHHHLFNNTPFNQYLLSLFSIISFNIIVSIIQIKVFISSLLIYCICILDFLYRSTHV